MFLVHKRLTLAILLCVATVLYPETGWPAEPNANAHQIIKALKNRLYAIGETSGNLEKFIAAEKSAADKIRAIISNNDRDPALIEKNKKDMTPLTSAAMMGYVKIAEALLESSLVVDHIDEPDVRGISPWVYANFGLRQSIFACNPTIAQNFYAWVPVFVTMPFYFQTKPYPQVRRLLASKGAKVDMEKAKQLWTQTCKRQSAETRSKVANGTDLLEVVTMEGAKTMMSLLKPK